MVRKRENIQRAAVVWTKIPCWCQRRMGRLVRDDKKATVTQITPLQNTISERTTNRILKQMGYSRRRPHRVLLLSAKNRKRRLQFAQASGCWWWCIFLAHFGPLVPIEHCLNATAYLSIVAEHVHPFMTKVYPSSDGYFQQDNAPCHKAQIISDWFLEHDNEFTLLKWPPQSPDLNPIEHIWGVVVQEIRIMDVQPTNLQHLCDAIVNMDQNLWGMFPTPCWIYAMKN